MNVGDFILKLLAAMWTEINNAIVRACYFLYFYGISLFYHLIYSCFRNEIYILVSYWLVNLHWNTLFK